MIYQIKVQGYVDSSWSDCFDEMEISPPADGEASCATVFTGPVEDQAVLRGILNHLWDLNLTLLSVTRIEAKDVPEARQENRPRRRLGK